MRDTCYSMNDMIDICERLWTDLFERLEWIHALWLLTWYSMYDTIDTYINCSNWTNWSYKGIMMSYMNEKNKCIYVVYSWIIQCFVYVMLHLNSRDTRIGITYTNDRDKQLGNELYEKNRGGYVIWFTVLKAIPDCMVTNGDIQLCDEYVGNGYKYMIWSIGKLVA